MLGYQLYKWFCTSGPRIPSQNLLEPNKAPSNKDVRHVELHREQGMQLAHLKHLKVKLPSDSGRGN